MTRFKLATKRGYRRPPVDFHKVKKSITLPDQAMSIQEIVKRFVRGIPVDVVQRQGVYVDQNDYDLERMSRMDFADKAAMAEELKDQAEDIKQQAQAQANERKRREQERQAAAQASANPKGAGIGVLDNTMPVDTTQK